MMGQDKAPRKLARGIVDRQSKEITFQVRSPVSKTKTSKYDNDKKALLKILSLFDENSFGHIDVIGHRVVHGGSQFILPVLLKPAVMRALEKWTELAPLHNAGALQAIHLTQSLFKKDMPMVAVFDTAFHHTIPEYAARYALPKALSKRHHIRRYGFHGIAHAYMLKQYSEISKVPEEKANLVTFQLGSGCSVCAIQNGKSIDTSMGFTPLEGLVMGTRSGDLDPSLIGYIGQKEKMDWTKIETLLNKKSGLLGVSGNSADMRDLMAKRKKSPQSALAIDLFCYRAKKYLGAYLSILGGAQAIVFGGGIGEHVPEIRAQICDGLEWLGIQIDPAANMDAVGKDGCITGKDSKIKAYVIAVDESVMIAEEAFKVLKGQRS